MSSITLSLRVMAKAWAGSGVEVVLLPGPFKRMPSFGTLRAGIVGGVLGKARGQADQVVGGKEAAQ